MNGVNKNIKYIYFYILSRATLNETFRAKYDGVFPRTPTPKSKIYTPKRDDEHPHPFHMRSTPPPRALEQPIHIATQPANTALSPHSSPLGPNGEERAP